MGWFPDWRARFVGECRCIPISTVALASASYPAHMAAIYDVYRNHQMIEYYHDSRTVTLHNRGLYRIVHSGDGGGGGCGGRVVLFSVLTND